MRKKIIIAPQKISFARRIKVRLDHKTNIIITKISSLEVWKKRYPNAYVVDFGN